MSRRPGGSLPAEPPNDGGDKPRRRPTVPSIHVRTMVYAPSAPPVPVWMRMKKTRALAFR